MAIDYKRSESGWDFVEAHKDRISNNLSSCSGKDWYVVIEKQILNLHRQVTDRRMRYEIIGAPSDDLSVDDILENIIYNACPDHFWIRDDDQLEGQLAHYADRIGPERLVEHMLSLQRELEQLDNLLFTQEYERNGKLADAYAEDMENIRHKRKLEELEKQKQFNEEYA